MATHSSILAWRIPRTEEPGELQSQCSKRVGQDLVTNIFTFYTHSSRREDSTHTGHMDVVVRGTVTHHRGCGRQALKYQEDRRPLVPTGECDCFVL